MMLFPHLGKTLTAVHRAVRLGLKRNLCLPAAASAHSGKILPRATSRSLTGIPAGLAALRLILEAPLSVKLLLSSSEYKLLTTFFAYQRLVFVHVLYPLFD